MSANISDKTFWGNQKYVQVDIHVPDLRKMDSSVLQG